jgi:hypothetical protein
VVDIQLDHASEIFRALSGDRSAWGKVTIEEVYAYDEAETFEEFLEINQIKTFEKIPK